MIELVCVIKGKVQGVGFRAYVENAATELSLVGWVRNEPDLSVKVVAQGFPDALKEFVEHLNEGSLLSRIDTIDIEWHDTREAFNDFSVLH